MPGEPLRTPRAGRPHAEPGVQQGAEGAGKALTDVTFGYHLDRSNPNMSVLRRLDGSVVVAFGVHTVIEEGIAQVVVEAAEEDYWNLIRAARRP